MAYQPASSDAPPSYEAATGGSQHYAKKDEQDPLNGPGQGYFPSDPAYPPYPPQGGSYPSNRSGNPPPPENPHVGQTIIIQQPGVCYQQFHEAPVTLICPTCQHSVTTTTSYESGTLAWVACVVLCLVGCDAGCCLIPFCCDSCQDVVHSCPNCNRTIGRYTRM